MSAEQKVTPVTTTNSPEKELTIIEEPEKSQKTSPKTILGNIDKDGLRRQPTPPVEVTKPNDEEPNKEDATKEMLERQHTLMEVTSGAYKKLRADTQKIEHKINEVQQSQKSVSQEIDLSYQGLFARLNELEDKIDQQTTITTQLQKENGELKVALDTSNNTTSSLKESVNALTHMIANLQGQVYSVYQVELQLLTISKEAAAKTMTSEPPKVHPEEVAKPIEKEDKTVKTTKHQENLRQDRSRSHRSDHRRQRKRSASTQRRRSPAKKSSPMQPTTKWNKYGKHGCALCSGNDHFPHNCQKVKNEEERIDILLSSAICLNCTQHTSVPGVPCRQYNMRCQVCSGKHATVVHPHINKEVVKDILHSYEQAKNK